MRCEQALIDEERDRELEKSKLCDQQQKEEWYKRRLELDLEMTRKKMEEVQVRPQSIKLEKYTITLFKGDFKDWSRFWNQFMVTVDGSSIASISKFNYLLKLVEGKPREDILGLPHTENGYKEAKNILEKMYGKDIKYHKALNKEPEGLEAISSIHNVQKIHEYYNKLTRFVHTLVTMKKLDSIQSYVYTLVDKFGPVKENLIQKDDDWKKWDLLELVENLEKYIDRHPLLKSESTGAKRRVNEHQADWRQRDKVVLANTMDRVRWNQNSCVFCELSNHKSTDYHKVLDVAHRREIVKRKKLCFNCTGFGHQHLIADQEVVGSEIGNTTPPCVIHKW